ncbi:hypothetical protein [Aquitalea pelogenes]|uniref:hypothetical protein n=1 Tax=Aquitalea pelogenes TaxID=1293573 RepID=UPI00128F3A87|nr:hypothetical protein [Aquitalea pelogenes]
MRKHAFFNAQENCAFRQKNAIQPRHAAMPDDARLILISQLSAACLENALVSIDDMRNTVRKFVR